jgi:hypothetical protein
MSSFMQSVPDGAVVEWFEQPSSIATGIIDNVPPVRRIGRVSHTRLDGVFLVIFDPDGVRRVIHKAAVTVIAEKAEAGWGRLA